MPESGLSSPVAPLKPASSEPTRPTSLRFWSERARAFVHPLSTFDELLRAPPRSRRQGVQRVAQNVTLLLVVIATFVSLTSAGRLTASHLALGPPFWLFVPAFQLAVPAVLLRLFAPDRPLWTSLSVYLVGNGPWMLLLLVVSAIPILASDVYETMSWLIASGVLPGALLVTILWSIVMTYAFYRAVSGQRLGGLMFTGAHYIGTTGVIVGYYLATNQIQPQL